MLKVGIIGLSGRMGHALWDAALGLESLKVVCGVCEAHTPLPHGYSAEVRTAVSELESSPDVFIDFSRPEVSLKTVSYAAEHGQGVVLGTTGFDAAQLRDIRAAAAKVPLVMAANFSVGVNVLLNLVRRVAAVMPDTDLEIVEAHHRYKVDAPSGTALAMGQAAAAGRGVELEAVQVAGRNGIVGQRQYGTIGFSSVRGGDIVGEHTAMFCADGERVELKHVATSRMTFARGALKAAVWLSGRKPGFYSLSDVLGLDKI